MKGADQDILASNIDEVNVEAYRNIFISKSCICVLGKNIGEIVSYTVKKNPSTIIKLPIIKLTSSKIIDGDFFEFDSNILGIITEGNQVQVYEINIINNEINFQLIFDFLLKANSKPLAIHFTYRMKYFLNVVYPTETHIIQRSDSISNPREYKIIQTPLEVDSIIIPKKNKLLLSNTLSTFSLIDWIENRQIHQVNIANLENNDELKIMNFYFVENSQKIFNHFYQLILIGVNRILIYFSNGQTSTVFNCQKDSKIVSSNYQYPSTFLSITTSNFQVLIFKIEIISPEYINLQLINQTLIEKLPAFQCKPVTFIDPEELTLMVAFVQENSLKVYNKKFEQNIKSTEEKKELNNKQNINTLFNSINPSVQKLSEHDFTKENTFFEMNPNNFQLTSQFNNLQNNVFAPGNDFQLIEDQKVETNIQPIPFKIDPQVDQNLDLSIFEKPKIVSKIEEEEFKKKDNEIINPNPFKEVPMNSIINSFENHAINKDNQEAINFENPKIIVESPIPENKDLLQGEEISKSLIDFPGNYQNNNTQINEINNNLEQILNKSSQSNTNIKVNEKEEDKIETITFTNIIQKDAKIELESKHIIDSNNKLYSSSLNSLLKTDENANIDNSNNLDHFKKYENEIVIKKNETYLDAGIQLQKNENSIQNSDLEEKVNIKKENNKNSKKKEEVNILPQIQSLPKESSDSGQELFLGNIFERISETNPFALNFDKNEALNPRSETFNNKNSLINLIPPNENQNKFGQESLNKMEPISKMSPQEKNRFYMAPEIPNSESSIRKMPGDKDKEGKKRKKKNKGQELEKIYPPNKNQPAKGFDITDVNNNNQASLNLKNEEIKVRADDRLIQENQASSMQRITNDFESHITNEITNLKKSVDLGIHQFDNTIMKMCQTIERQSTQVESLMKCYQLFMETIVGTSSKVIDTLQNVLKMSQDIQRAYSSQQSMWANRQANNQYPSQGISNFSAQASLNPPNFYFPAPNPGDLSYYQRSNEAQFPFHSQINSNQPLKISENVHVSEKISNYPMVPNPMNLAQPYFGENQVPNFKYTTHEDSIQMNNSKMMYPSSMNTPLQSQFIPPITNDNSMITHMKNFILNQYISQKEFDLIFDIPSSELIKLMNEGNITKIDLVKVLSKALNFLENYISQYSYFADKIKRIQNWICLIPVFHDPNQQLIDYRELKVVVSRLISKVNEKSINDILIQWKNIIERP